MKRDHKIFMMMLLFFPLTLILTSCGGGGGGGGVVSSTPVISNLRFSPSSVSAWQGNGVVTVIGQIDFTDPGGDMTTLRLTSSSGQDLTITIPGISGLTKGTISGTFSVSTTSPGTFTLVLQ